MRTAVLIVLFCVYTIGAGCLGALAAHALFPSAPAVWTLAGFGCYYAAMIVPEVIEARAHARKESARRKLLFPD